MTLREWSALVSAVLVVAGCIWYALQAVLGKTKPVFAGWVIMSSVMLLSYATYWTTAEASLVSNVSNAASVLGGIIVVLAVAKIDRRKSLRLTRFQKLCLWVTSVIFIFWIILVAGCRLTGDIPFWMTQTVMLIGHSMTAQHLWHARKNTESLFTWWCTLIASVVAIYVATDTLAVIYATRAALTSATLVWLMHRISWHNHRL